MYFNGTRRLVEIDDILICEKTRKEDGNIQEMLVNSRCKESTEMWISLLEKSILKLYSQNMKIVSNPAMECFHMIGW